MKETDINEDYEKTMKLLDEVSKITKIQKDELLISFGATHLAVELMEEVSKKRKYLLSTDDIDSEILWSKFSKVLTDLINSRPYLDKSVIEDYSRKIFSNEK